MARVIPAHPVYGHPTEEKVVDLLRDQLSDDSLIVVGQRVSTYEKEHEVDILVAMPGAGIVAIEVKLAQTVDEGDTKHLRWLKQRLDESVLDRVIITTGPQAYRRRDGIAVVPLALLGQ